MKILMRFLLGIGTTIFLLLVIALTPLGLKAGMFTLKSLIPGKLEYKNISGLIVGPITIKKLSYENKGFSLKIDKLHLQWRPLYLLTGKLRISRIESQHLQVTLGPSETAGNTSWRDTLNRFDYLKRLQLLNGKLEDVSIVNGDTSVVFTTIRWQGLRWRPFMNLRILVDATKPYALHSEFLLRGPIVGYDFFLTLQSKEINWHLKGRGSSNYLKWILKEPNTLGGSLDTNGEVQFNSRISWSVWGIAKHLNLARLHSNWTSLDGHLSSVGYYQDKQPFGNINFGVHTADTELSIKGQHKNDWDIKTTLALKDVSGMNASWLGSLQANATLQGETSNPVFKITVNSNDLELPAYSIDFPKMQLQVQGTWGAHHVHCLIEAKHSSALLRLENQLDGSFEQKKWQGQIKQFSFDFSKGPVWKLKAPSRLAVSSEQFTLSSFCLISKKDQFCLNGNWGKGAWGIQAQGQGDFLSPFIVFSQPDIDVKIPLRLSANVTGFGKLVQNGSINLLFYPGSLTNANRNTVLHWIQSNFQTNINDATIQTTAQLNLSRINTMAAEIKLLRPIVLDGNLKSQALSGQITIQLGELKQFNLLLPPMVELSGRLRFDLNVKGPLDSPLINGHLNMLNGKFRILLFGVELHNIQGDIKSELKKTNIKLIAYIQNNPIELKGHVDWLEPTLFLDAKATNIQIANTPQYHVSITPDLKIEAKPQQIHISGKVLVPQALIRPTDFNNSVGLPADLVFVHEGQVKTLKLSFRIALVLGDQIFLDSHGVKAKLKGNLLIIQNPGNMPLATGRIEIVNGQFTLQPKQAIIISPGSYIAFSQSALSNPHLNIRATRRVNTAGPGQISRLNSLVVGVDVRGTVENPQINLFSSPTKLPKTDILSYLVFGQPATGNPLNNFNLLLQAIQTLKIGGASQKGPFQTVDQISQKLGLSEFGITSQTSLDLLGTPSGQNENSLVIGRYLTPKIYVRYSRGLISSIDIVQIRYLISPNWMVQTEINTLGNGADILYTIQSP